MAIFVNDLKSLYATPIETWESLIREIEHAKLKGNEFAVAKRIEDFQELCYSPYPAADKLTDWKQQQIALYVQEYLLKKYGINNMLEILEVLKYLGVTSISIDLFTELKTIEGISKSIIPAENPEQKPRIIMNKIYTDGTFLLRPLVIQRKGSMEEYCLDDLRNKKWEIITKNIEEGNTTSVEERVAILHSLGLNPRKFPSKQELDNMDFPKLNEILNRKSKGLPWDYQARYEETYPKVGFQYKKELK